MKIFVFVVIVLSVIVPTFAGSPASRSANAAQRIECDKEFIKHAGSAWMMTHAGSSAQEAGFRIDVVDGSFVYSDVKMGYPGELHMDISINAHTVAIFHTHPNAGVSEPNGKDFSSWVPNYVLSKRGLAVTIPSASRESVPGVVRYEWLQGCTVKTASKDWSF